MTTFAAITTRRLSAIGNTQPAFAAQDGNGRKSVCRGIDPMLGLVDQHREALRNHLGDQAEHADIYTPGYLTDDPDNWTLVWVRTR